MSLRTCLWCDSKAPLKQERGGYRCPSCDQFTPLPRTVDGTDYTGRGKDTARGDSQ